MRFAIFLDNLNFEHLSRNVKQMYLFDLTDNIIIAVGEESVFMENANYILLRLLSKKVTFIFIDDLADNIILLFAQAGIEVKTLSELKENPLMDTILFKEI